MHVRGGFSFKKGNDSWNLRPAGAQFAKIDLARRGCWYICGMLYYTVKYSDLTDGIREEVSRVADAAYSNEGEPLYDQVVITARDYDAVRRLIGDSLSVIVTRMSDVCLYSPVTEGNTVTMRLAFYLPDYPYNTLEQEAEDELSRFIILFSTAQYLSQKHPESVQGYTERAQASLVKAVSLLKTRQAPLESWT